LRPAAELGATSWDSHDAATLERAVERLDRATSRILLARGRLHPSVETQLLALLGELSIGLVGEAASRAERLAQQLAPTGVDGG
jgi:hypothetical protein